MRALPLLVAAFALAALLPLAFHAVERRALAPPRLSDRRSAFCAPWARALENITFERGRNVLVVAPREGASPPRGILRITDSELIPLTC